MTAQRTRPNFRAKVRAMANFMDGVAACAAAAEAGRRPSRRALTDAGIDADAYYNIGR